jgi:membrane protease YdiL (CAAX protease family)
MADQSFPGGVPQGEGPTSPGAWPNRPEPSEVAATTGRPAPPQGQTMAAWIVITLAVAAAIALAQFGREELSGGPEDPVGNVLMEIQGRYMVGAAELLGQGQALFDQAKTQLNIGTVGQRQRFVILTAELAGPQQARSILAELENLIEQEKQATANEPEPFELTEEQRKVQEILRQLYPLDGQTSETEASSAEVNLEAVDADERRLLREQLGWFGRLALAPPGSDADRRDAVLQPAVTTTYAFIGLVVGLGLAGLAGLVGLILTIVLAMGGRMRAGLAAGRTHHGIYAETFAIWIVIFFLLQIAAGLLATALPEIALLLAFVAMFMSLGVLLWPVFRGVPWSMVSADIGCIGRRPVTEVLMGIAGYGMALPLLGIGILLTLMLLLIQTELQGEPSPFAPAGGPAHPIVLEIADGNVFMIIQVLLIGAVAAPIVEETMFRGVLYRHLRDGSRSLGTALSILIGVTVNGLVFAVIHPQGFVAIPALFALSTAFTLAREWRGSLIPSILMHAINNGLVLGMLSFLTAL